MSTQTQTITLANLPDLKQPLDGGTFCGVITMPDGQHCAVVLLADRPAKRLPWAQAVEWAASVGGRLPSRPIAALLYSLAKELVAPDWYWTNEPEDDEYAWYCCFDCGGQHDYHQTGRGAAVAVRMIPLTP